MTPDRRLDQLEPLVADALIKIDRLIEGQGQIIELATRADQNATTAARGVANLTISTQRQFDELKFNQDELRSRFDQLSANQDKLKIGQDELRTDVNELKIGQEQLKIGQELIL